jgi:prephenate dehydratase
VNETHDLLYGSPLSITAETILPIHHCLVGPAVVALEEVREVHSHPVALDQCRRLLARMPWAQAVAAGTTADAAAAVARLGEPSVVAIASERAARLYGLELVADDVGDHPEAYTRFVAVAPYTRLDRDPGSWRTAFSFVTDHRPGALHRAIEPFARHEIDLVQLVSRPIPHSTWRYRFDAVLGGHPLDAEIAGALVELRGLTRELRVFGSYPVAG